MADKQKKPFDLVDVELTLNVIKACTNPPPCPMCDRAAKRLLDELRAALAPQPEDK